MFSKGSRGNFDPKIKVGVTTNKFLFLLGNGSKTPVTESVPKWVKGVTGTPFPLTNFSLLRGFFGEKRIPFVECLEYHPPTNVIGVFEPFP